MNKLIEEELEQGLSERQINEQFVNEYIYKLSLFNPELHNKISKLCAITYLLSQQLKLPSKLTNQIYMYSSLYYIKDSKVIQVKMSNYCKRFDNIKKIESTGISFYTEDLMELIIMLCDKFLTLHQTKPYDECIKILQEDEIIPQILVQKLKAINKTRLESEVFI